MVDEMKVAKKLIIDVGVKCNSLYGTVFLINLEYSNFFVFRNMCTLENGS